VTEFVIHSVAGGYLNLIEAVQEYGSKVAVRGQPTIELLGTTVRLLDPTDVVPSGVNRNFSMKILAAEVLQLLGGAQYPELLTYAGHAFAQFLDGGAFHGAYGPRLRSQLPRIQELLLRDETTRQAVAEIWDPLHDLRVEDPARDVPCTLGFQFLVRDGKLSLISRMRSQDLWWGYAYDLAMFGQLLCTMANTLGLGFGQLIHQVGSFHLYERDLDAANQVRAPQHNDRLYLPGLGYYGQSWVEVARTARLMIDAPEDVSSDCSYAELTHAITGWETRETRLRRLGRR
jgi:thymidylate synthase